MCSLKSLAGAVLCLGLLAGPAGADTVRFVSEVPPGLESVTGNGVSRTFDSIYSQLTTAQPPGSLLSADGRYAVFVSDARDLIAGLTDANGSAEIYLFDRIAGSVVLVSRSAAGPATAANGESRFPSISADGRYVAFSSLGTDLVAGQTDDNNGFDVFVFDRIAGTQTLVSRAAGTTTTAGGGASGAPVLSADGHWIAFPSDADDLVAGQGASSAEQLFLFDRAAGSAVLVSHTAAGASTPGNGVSNNPALSADGSFVTYTSTATDLAAGVTDGNFATDVFLFDRSAGQSQLVSRSSGSATTAGNGESFGAVLSADGSHVAFVSRAANLVPGQSGSTSGNVFRFRRADGAMTLVSHSMAGEQQAGNDQSWTPSINQDGSAIAFTSAAEDLAPHPAGVEIGIHVYLFQASNGSILLLTESSPGTIGDVNHGLHPRISADGNRIAFTGMKESFGSGLPLFKRDIYLYDRGSASRTLVSRSWLSPSAPSNYDSTAAELSADGQIVFFTSLSQDVVENDFNNLSDAFVYSRATGTNTLASRAVAPSKSTGWESNSAVVSDDGNVVVFVSDAQNLASGQVDPRFFRDVFAWSRLTGRSTLLSRAAGTAAAAANNFSMNPAVSADGDWIAFATAASDLVPAPQASNTSVQLVLVERATGNPLLVSHLAGNPATAGAGAPHGKPVLNRDGRFIAFPGSFKGLVPGQIGSSYNVFLYDRLARAAVLVTHKIGNPAHEANASAEPFVDLSADGRFLVFASPATDLMAGLTDGNGASDVFLYDRDTGALTLVSRKAGAAATTGAGHSAEPTISADGRWVLFRSMATDLVAGQTDFGGTPDLFLFDRTTGATSLVSHADGQPAQALGDVAHFDLSADGRFATFERSAQIYLHDRTTGGNLLVSHAAGAPTVPGNDAASLPWISADGRFVAFSSQANDAVAGMTDDDFVRPDAFLYDRITGETELLSRADATPLEAESGTARGLSADGGQVLVETAGGLVSADRNRITDLYLYENLLPAQDFHSVTLCRALDTRHPTDGPALTSGLRELFTVPGACGVPATAKAVVLNVTATQAAGAGYLKLHAGNASTPASTINFAANQTRSNNTTVRLSTNGDGTIAVTPFVTGGGTVHVILDVMGYYE